MSDIVERLRQTKISAPPEHPIHPSICTEAADEIERLEAERDAYKTELKAIAFAQQHGLGPEDIER